MESNQTEDITIKHCPSVNDRWLFLRPMVYSCKLHRTLKSPAERIQRTSDCSTREDQVTCNDIHLVCSSNQKKKLFRYTSDQGHLIPLPPQRGFIESQVLTTSPSSIETGTTVTQTNHQKAKRTYSHPVNTSKPIGLQKSHRRSHTGFQFIQLHREASAANPLRIDLDRSGLEECPNLAFIGELQLLNLQHNYIRRIQHLSKLQHLIFLNLYDNHITDMAGLEYLNSLRILMLGKNRIQKIKCLDHLVKLNVLDLHDNQISIIQNVSQLWELRVLNLSGNNISRVENVRGLNCLTELNLRHNCISAFAELDFLPCLQRLFLSCNNISSFDQLAHLGELCSLSELTLDGNPVALETWYKQAVLRCVLHLKQLDMKRITDEDRRTAGIQARKEEEKKRESHKQSIHKEKRRLAIRNAAQQWEGVRACLEMPPTNGAKEEFSPENSPAHSPAQSNGVTQESSPEEPKRISPGSGPERLSGGPESRLRSNSRPNSPRDPKLVETGSVQSLSMSESHLAELDGETLRLFGLGALEALERGWGVQTAGAVTVITFRYINFDSIVPTLPRIRVKFPNLLHLIFLETSISRLPQLAALAQVRRLDQLTIHPEGNPVVSLSLWRSFVIYRLHHFNLQRINGQEVTMNDVIAAERVFGTLGHIAATETPRCRLLLLLEESRKRQLQFLLEGRGRRAGLSPEELRENGKLLGEGLSRALFNYPSRDSNAESPEEGTVESSERASMTEQYLQDVAQRASDTNLKGEALHKLWPSMFAEMVKDCVLEMKDQAAFRRASLARLSETK
ncbi:leucine-rich repeat-containing protein 49 [Boleophthalmus pectinirostris]|uniref:leucine-rich repeat-containing protein 49 n=1 Tax=Boleophthalmus pectinirostris TaxID=150288 RepID=UPI00242BCF9D|nr:leucine-rich repeat-containing protein 49 [Boleophthalmus pectinirostris]